MSRKIFAKGQKLALDTVALIYFLERHPVHYATAKKIFRQLEAGHCTGVMSSLVFAELLVPAYRAKDARQAGQLVQLLTNFPNLEIISLTPQLSVEAAKIRANHGLRTPDAIHAATALAAGVDCFITNDKRFSALGDQLVVSLFDGV
ncbi:MAG: type II toxin-antitoxin system VapC family toxin [Thermodesulfobacteriota bacterium]